MRSLLVKITLVTFLFVFFISGQLHAQEKNDGRFIAKGNGTVLDTKTGLMWADRDNGRDINWINAKSYCENYRGGGYTDWRMPTLDELSTLYDEGKSYKTTQQSCNLEPGYDSSCDLHLTEVDTDRNCKATQRSCNLHLTELIQLSNCCPWGYEKRTGGFDASVFRFDNGLKLLIAKSFLKFTPLRALPVRFGK